MEGLQKKTWPAADFALVYGFAPFHAPEWLLFLHLDAARAQKELDARKAQSALTALHLKNLIEARTGDEDLADKLAAKWAEKQLAQGQQPEMG